MLVAFLLFISSNTSISILAEVAWELQLITILQTKKNKFYDLLEKRSKPLSELSEQNVRKVKVKSCFHG